MPDDEIQHFDGDLDEEDIEEELEDASSEGLLEPDEEDEGF
jgi:hypothetical protein